MNRHITLVLFAAEPLAYSDNMTPLQAFNLTMQTIFRTIHYKGGLLFDFLYEDSTMHLIDKLTRQGQQVINPLLQKIIEKGLQKGFFHFSSSQVVLNVISAMGRCIIDVIYEKSSADLINQQFKLTEDLISYALGIPPGTVKLRATE